VGGSESEGADMKRNNSGPAAGNREAVENRSTSHITRAAAAEQLRGGGR
jgi:hypothetical protein